MKYVNLKNARGFSLIELMIVVAIIGILSAIAIPNYQRFQRKARQSEAKTLLSAYYTASKATQAEFGYFTGDFVSAGFQPEGTVGYQISTGNGTDPTSGPSDDGCIITSAACTGGTAPGGYKTWTEGPNVQTGTTAIVVGANAFLTSAASNLGATSNDEWSIDEKKALLQVTDGL